MWPHFAGLQSVQGALEWLSVAEREIRCFMASELPWALLALQFVLLCIPCSVPVFVGTRGWWDKDVTLQLTIKRDIPSVMLCHWQQQCPPQAPFSPRTPSQGTALPEQDSSWANEKQRIQPGLSWVSFRPLTEPCSQSLERDKYSALFAD